MGLATAAAPFEPLDTAPAPETGGLREAELERLAELCKHVSKGPWVLNKDEASFLWEARTAVPKLLSELVSLRAALAVPTVAATNAQLVSENEYLKDCLKRANEMLEESSSARENWKVLAIGRGDNVDGLEAELQKLRDDYASLTVTLAQERERLWSAESARDAALARVKVLEEALIMAKLHLSLPYPEEEPEERMRVVAMIRTALAHEAQRPEEERDD